MTILMLPVPAHDEMYAAGARRSLLLLRRKSENRWVSVAALVENLEQNVKDAVQDLGK